MTGPSCDGKPNDWVLHFRGGLFRLWGGGMSHVFSDPKAKPNDYFCPPDADFCVPPLPAGAAFDSAGLPTHGKSGDDYLQSHDFVDASRYEGIAFWARRGPDGQERMNVTVTDNFTSDRLNRENETFCRRIRQCRTHCENGMPCVQDPKDLRHIYRCLDPNAASLIGAQGDPRSVDAAVDLMYPRCGPSACTSPDSYLDRDFDTTQCLPYTFPAADESAEYCFNPDGPPPPWRDERCLDGFATSVGLTLDWQFFTVPFSEMQQGGYGKKAPYLNLKALDTVAFSFLVGYADAYIDNVAFYRHKK